uniref:ORF1 protein n=1 Tax=Fowl adenovirus A serotype 1 (strain CELO / Phelps) TaxID=10553 RepID=Q64773_ADEG1|nr:ORF1 [Fowl aviadenovirus 1]
MGISGFISLGAGLSPPRVIHQISVENGFLPVLMAQTSGVWLKNRLKNGSGSVLFRSFLVKTPVVRSRYCRGALMVVVPQRPS